MACATTEADAARKRDSEYVLVPEACDVRTLERGVRNGRLVVEDPMPHLVWARLARSAVHAIPPPAPETPPKEALKEGLKENERECTPTSLSEASCSKESLAAETAAATTTPLGEQPPSENQNQSQNVPAPVASAALLWRGWPDQFAMFFEEFKRMGFDEKHWQVYDNANYRCYTSHE